MSDIKSLADELRNKIKASGEPADVTNRSKEQKTEIKAKPPPEPEIPPILELLRTYDNSDHKSMVHVRFDAQTLKTMNHFKMATGIDVTKLVAYAVRELFVLHPELKNIIKQFIQKLD